MAVYDREYWQDAPRHRTPFGGVRMWSVTTWIIVINVAVFLLDQLLDRAGFGYQAYVQYRGNMLQSHFSPLSWWGHFSASTFIYGFQFWRCITFQFLHANTQHLFFNMLALYFFGPIIENYLGSRRYLAFYLLCGVGGAIGYLILWGMHILIEAPWVPLVGASAGIFGVLIASAQIAPDATVLIYGIIPVRLRMMAWVLLGIAVYTVFTNGQNAGGEAAHLGGAAAGAILLRSQGVLNFFEFRRRPRVRMWNYD